MYRANSNIWIENANSKKKKKKNQPDSTISNIQTFFSHVRCRSITFLEHQQQNAGHVLKNWTTLIKLHRIHDTCMHRILCLNWNSQACVPLLLYYIFKIKTFLLYSTFNRWVGYKILLQKTMNEFHLKNVSRDSILYLIYIFIF